MNVTDKLLQLKAEIDEAKIKIAELNGKKESLMQDLKKNWNCTTLKQAEKKLVDLEGDVKDLSKQIEKGVAELEEKYEL